MVFTDRTIPPTKWGCFVCAKIPDTLHLQPDALRECSRLVVVNTALQYARATIGTANALEVATLVDRELKRWDRALLDQPAYDRALAVAHNASNGELVACANYIAAVRKLEHVTPEQMARAAVTRWLHADGGLREIMNRLKG